LSINRYFYEKKLLYCLVLVLFASVYWEAQAQTILFSRLTSENDAIRVKAKQETVSAPVNKEQDTISKEILTFLEKKPVLSKTIQGDLIDILGNLKRVDAIPYLIDHITFSAATAKYIYNPMRYRYRLTPAQDALVGIGEPAIPPLLDTLKKTSDDGLEKTYIWTLYRIVGRTRVTEYLNQLIKDETNETKRGQLKANKAIFD